MPLSSEKFANAGHRQASNYERKFRKRVPIAEIVDVLRRQAAFDVPLKFIVDRDSESTGFFKRGPQWDFGNAGVRFGKDGSDESKPVLTVTWSNEVEQKTLQQVLEEIAALGFDEDAEVLIELVSPQGDCLRSRYGNAVAVEKDTTVIHFIGAWQK